MSDLLALIAEPRRRAIVRFVWEVERTAGEIAAQFDVTFGAVSQHLKRLTDAGLLRLRREGQRRLYRANREAFGALAPALEAMWLEQLTRLKALAEAEERNSATHGATSPKSKPRKQGPLR